MISGWPSPFRSKAARPAGMSPVGTSVSAPKNGEVGDPVAVQVADREVRGLQARGLGERDRRPEGPVARSDEDRRARVLDVHADEVEDPVAVQVGGLDGARTEPDRDELRVSEERG